MGAGRTCASCPAKAVRSPVDAQLISRQELGRSHVPADSARGRLAMPLRLDSLAVGRGAYGGRRVLLRAQRQQPPARLRLRKSRRAGDGRGSYERWHASCWAWSAMKPSGVNRRTVGGSETRVVLASGYCAHGVGTRMHAHVRSRWCARASACTSKRLHAPDPHDQQGLDVFVLCTGFLQMEGAVWEAVCGLRARITKCTAPVQERSYSLLI
eukprot:353830-Chlamydomonas_euryale.AAC.5